MNFLVLDTETTALPHENGSIVEIAILEVREWEVVDRLHFMIKPTTPMTPGAALSNGIKEKDLEKCPMFSAVEPEITAWLSMGLPVVGYNCDRFDKEMIRIEYDRLKRPVPAAQWVDVYKIVYEKYPLSTVEEKTGNKSRSQVNMAKFFDVSAVGAHRALADVETLLGIYRKIHEEKPLPIVKPPSDFDIKKNKALDSLSKVKVEVVAVKAIQLAASLSSTVADKVAGFTGIKVSDDKSNEEAAKAIAWLSNAKKDAVKARQDALAEIKSVTSSIEEMFRDWVIKPIDKVSEELSSNRQLFIQKQYEQRIEEANRKKRELEKLAEEAAKKIFEQVKKEKNVDDAVVQSDIVYGEIMHEAATVTAAKETEIRAGSTKIIDKIVFDVEIVNPASVPEKWLIPDVEAITKYVNETSGEVPIAGVAFFPRAESKVRKR